MHDIAADTLILHESEAFICKALQGEAIENYASLLITQQMEASGLPVGWKLMRKIDLNPLNSIGICYDYDLNGSLLLDRNKTSH